MSDLGLYPVQRGTDVAGNLPPVDLPTTGTAPKQDRLNITVTRPKPAPQSADPWADAGFKVEAPKGTPGAKAAEQPAVAPGTDPWAAAGFGEFAPSSTEASKEMTAPKAAVTGAIDTATFGLAPTLAGVTEAGRATPEGRATESAMAGVPSEAPGLEGAGVALSKMFGEHANPEVREAYERGRKAALENKEAAKEKHPYAFFGGQLAGSLLTPGFGAGTAGTTGARIASGAIAGAAGAGLQGTGEAISEGKSLPQAAEAGIESVPFGAATGGVLKGAVGPRIAKVPTPITQGQRAAQTAVELGAPLPRGLTSDNRAVQGTTAKLRSVPFVGDRISNKVEKTTEAAGERVGDISSEMTGGTQGRAVANTMVRPALQDVIDQNRAAADAGYKNVRSMIDQNAHFTMPRTDAALNEVMRARAAAGHSNPSEGLEQFRNVAGGATFNGAHRARVDAREAGNVLVPHPGYNAGDYNRITRAMTADLRDMVQAAAAAKRSSPQAALKAFDEAETRFGKIAEQNKILNRLVNSQGEGAIGALLGAAKEKGGNVQLLAQLRQSMSPQEFQQVGGTLLHELAHNAATGEFSLAQFVTNWNKVSDPAKSVLFSQQHLKNINDIVSMGEHIKGSLRQSNTSHTGSFLMLLDLAKDAALLGHDVMSGGGLGVATMVGAGSTAVLGTLAHWLGNPSRAASMAAWSRAYGAAMQRPNPARIAAFKITTRNMANNLGLDPAVVMRKIEGSISGESQTGQSQPNER